VNALLDMVLASYAIDQKKIAVTGYKLGGQAWPFAQKFPHLIAAIPSPPGPPPESASGWRLVLAILRATIRSRSFQSDGSANAELQKPA